VLATVLGALVDIPPHAGYALVFVLIALETMGIPLPGETALILASLQASRGESSIEIVIVLAACAAIIGDNFGFMVGRKLGRRVFVKPGFMHPQRLRMLEIGEPFFARHGPKAVFLGRWVGGLRIASAWLAGMNKMNWPTFLFWNALGGICWATAVGLGVYFGGEAFERAVKTVGVAGAVALAVVIVGFFVWRHWRHRQHEQARLREIREEQAGA
jgi:membrane-associated protein